MILFLLTYVPEKSTSFSHNGIAKSRRWFVNRIV